MPGLDPISVQEIVLGKDDPFDVAFIQDSQQRRWVIRAPRTEVAAARMDASMAMLGLLVRRVPFSVPSAKGFAPIPNVGRAAVHSYIPGNPLDLAALHPRHPVTSELGRTIGMIHNVDRALFDEAGLPAYDAEAYRKRHLAEIDRGAATGRVPAGLLARWEEALDDVRLWRFAPTPIHGSLDGAALLVTFPDPQDSTQATIRGVTGWEDAQVADPADDFAALVGQTRSEVVDAVFAAYRQVRVERPDEHLLARARLVSELQLLAALLSAVAGRDEVATEALTARLRRLDDAVHDDRQARRLRIVPFGPVPVTGDDLDELERPSTLEQSASAQSGSAQSAPAESAPAQSAPATDNREELSAGEQSSDGAQIPDEDEVDGADEDLHADDPGADDDEHADDEPADDEHADHAHADHEHDADATDVIDVIPAGSASDRVEDLDNRAE